MQLTREPHQRSARLVIKPRIGREGNGLLLDRRVDIDAFDLSRLKRLRALRRLERLPEQFLDPVRTHPLPPPHQ